ncbi:MAG: gliding motility lipoprotein GldB, partial [Bacteroidota bacterium]|nr:gliding motility lipoprotein GldB [Bacteroidota bacterium]
SAFAKKVLPYPRNRTLLSRMVYYGKELYLKDVLIPSVTDAQKIGYSEDQLEWARANEEQMWKYFVERELLYSTDTGLDRKFLDPAPFSKFGLELDNESPPRLGRYMGWQIVRAFMEKTDMDLKQMLRLPADEILKQSNYKPKR